MNKLALCRFKHDIDIEHKHKDQGYDESESGMAYS